ncbi:3-oxoacyl-[acyl-carrier-protein] synthase, mitochondrial, partial [Caerostris darwini]
KQFKYYHYNCSRQKH